MTMPMRRRFFLFAAPAIVAAPSLMRVSAAVLDSLPSLNEIMFGDGAQPYGVAILNELVTATIRNRSAYFAEAVRKNNAILRYLAEGTPTEYSGISIEYRNNLDI